jgi:Flp pilus assembly protein TadD
MGILETLAGDASLAADPDGAPLRSDIAALLIKIGEGEMANALLLDIVSSGHGDGKTWTQVGLGYLEKGNVPQAAESLEKALSLEPNNALALSGMGTVHLTLFRGRGERGDLERAIAFYTKAKEASPGLVAAWNGLGVAWSYAGDPEQAVAHWRQALLVDPGFTNTYFNLGITLLQSGRTEEARAILSACLEKHSAKLSEGEMRQLRALLEEASR